MQPLPMTTGCRPRVASAQAAVLGAILAFLLSVIALYFVWPDPTGKVLGKLTSGDEPVAGAEIAFVKDGVGDAFRGISNADGTFALDYREKPGLEPGKYLVTVQKVGFPGGKSLPPGEAGAALVASGKASKQTFRFDADIVSGKNAVNLDLAKAKKA